MINQFGIEILEYIEGIGELEAFRGIKKESGIINTVPVKIKSNNSQKVFYSIEEILDKLDLKDGICVSFHHHLRNGDKVLNFIMESLAKRGIKDIMLAPSSVFPVHEPLVEHIMSGCVTKITSSYISGPVAKAISEGKLKYPAILTTHGGRPALIESGKIHIDIAFVAAASSDSMGNINGINGKSAFGTLGYAVADAEYADTTVVITDNLVDYPNAPIDISQIYTDYVLVVDSIGDPSGIVAGTTRITKDPLGLKIAALTSKLIFHSGYFKNGMSFQTGAGGTSLAVAAELAKLMQEKNIKGSFASGGTNSFIVDMLNKNLFEYIFDTQCFDLAAVESYKSNPKHLFMSCSMYTNPNRKGTVADMLDIMILGATEIDKDFNVNVITGSDGYIMGGSGGHSDTAAGAKLSIVVTNLIKTRIPIVKEKITTITTPGESIDVLVTEYGIAINPLRKDIIEKLKNTNLPIVEISELIKTAEKICGIPKEIKFDEKIVALVMYRDGTIIDTVRKVL